MANEKRLIDANALLDLLRPLEGVSLIIKKILAIIRNCPTIDAVEVVRCKDCLWFDQKDKLADVFRQERHCYCTDMNTYMPESGFCSSGERKDNERKAD